MRRAPPTALSARMSDRRASSGRAAARTGDRAARVVASIRGAIARWRRSRLRSWPGLALVIASLSSRRCCARPGARRARRRSRRCCRPRAAGWTRRAWRRAALVRDRARRWSELRDARVSAGRAAWSPRIARPRWLDALSAGCCCPCHARARRAARPSCAGAWSSAWPLSRAPLPRTDLALLDRARAPRWSSCAWRCRRS